MILISGCFRFAPETRAAALAAALAMAAETRKEAGCITYGFFADVEDENTFRIFEQRFQCLSRPRKSTFQ